MLILINILLYDIIQLYNIFQYIKYICLVYFEIMEY